MQNKCIFMHQRKREKRMSFYTDNNAKLYDFDIEGR